MSIIPADILAGLRARYAEPHRGYHDQSHIDALLSRFARAGWRDPDAVELAIWYHDAIYQVLASGHAGNEAASAALLTTEMAGDAEPGLLARAAGLVLATERHAVPAEMDDMLAADCAAFLDLDLSVLGAPPDIYDGYAKGVAFEYVPVLGEAAYRRGRAEFLRGALGRRLFLTGAAQRELGFAASANMRRELASLARNV